MHPAKHQSHAAAAWFADSQREGLIRSHQPAVRRSQVECGVSVEWLAAFVKLVKRHNGLSAVAKGIVDHVVHAATANRQCAMCALIPAEHVGRATAVVSHAWSGDFLEAITAVTEEFNFRWNAHHTYRRQLPGVVKLLAEDQEAMAEAAAGAARAEEEAIMASHRPVQIPQHCRKQDASASKGNPRQSVVLRRMTESGERGYTASGSNRPQDAVDSRPRLPQLDLRQSQAGAPPSVKHEGACKDKRPSPAAGKGAASLFQKAQGQNAIIAAMAASGAGRRGLVLGPSPNTRSLLTKVAQAPPSDLSGSNGMTMTRPSVVQQQQSSVQSQGQPRQETLTCHRRSIGAGVGLVSTQNLGQNCMSVVVKPPLSNLLMRSGASNALASEDTSFQYRKSIYERAQANSDLTCLLSPVDEEQELLEMREAQQAAAKKLSAAALSTTSEEQLLQAEKRNMQGYFVWIDVFALAQFGGKVPGPDLLAMDRLINVVGRTILVVDDGWRCLTRAWCQYEVFCTLRHKGTLVTVSTAAAINAPHLAAFTPYNWPPTFNPSRTSGEPSGPPQPVNLVCATSSRPSTVSSMGTAPLARPGSGPALQNAKSLSKYAPPAVSGELGGHSPGPLSAPSTPAAAFGLGGERSSSAQRSLGSPLPSGVSMASIDEREEGEGTLPALEVPLVVDLQEARAALAEDKAAFLAVWHAEVFSPRSNFRSMSALATSIREAVVAARAKEQALPQLLEDMYSCLTLSSLTWQDDVRDGDTRVRAEFQDLVRTRTALRAMVERHFPRQLARAPELSAAAEADIELELWQLITFVMHQLQRQRADPILVSDFKRYSEAAHRSFGTRFSSSYVDTLLRQARTFDDMGVLRSYVASQCRVKKISGCFEEDTVKDIVDGPVAVKAVWGGRASPALS